MNGRGLLRTLFPGLVGGVGLAVAAVVLFPAFTSTATPPTLLASTAPVRSDDFTLQLRPVRVLIHSDAECVWIGAEHEIRVRDERGRLLMALPPQLPPRSLCVVGGSGDRFRFGTHSFSATALLLTDSADGPFTVSESGTDAARSDRKFAGALRVRLRDDDHLDVVNEVDIEPYVASVVASEVWPTFDAEAMRAQAIAARTYVVYQMMRREQHPFDVAATQGSQVYRGVRADDIGLRAAAAARYTRGVLCTYGEPGAERVFCAYYGAACGGLSQPAAIFGAEGDIAPLSGGVACDYCKIAPADVYRWGPVRLSKEDLARRLGARYPEIAAMNGIRRLDVLARTATGRPTMLRIVGENGRTFDLLAERFRHAVGPMEIRSTDFQLRDQGSGVVFDHGRGFGHGLGLCQWGSQGQARLGRHAGDILRHYYPGAKLTKGY